MSFAVIEYTTKTGDIWKPTPERPNYLADPIKEIDPTSFACYTTALNGEHIPLVGLIIGPVNTRNALNVFIYKIIKKLTTSWPQWYSLEYLQKFDILLVVHQISNAHEVTSFVKRLKQTYPEKIILGVPTQPFGLLKKAWEADPGILNEVKKFISHCDAFITVVEKTHQEWQSLTSTKTVYLPQPYPVHYAEQFFKPVDEKEKIIFVAGVTDRPNIRKGQQVAVALQKRFPEYTIEVTDTPGTILDTSVLNNSDFKIKPFQEWREHLQYLNTVKLVINTDYTSTRGRVQVDCAVVGTISLGADSDGQYDLFPELVSNEQTSVDKLVQQASDILEDETYYTRLSTYATDQLQKYGYKQSAQRLLDLAEEVKKSNHV